MSTLYREDREAERGGISMMVVPVELCEHGHYKEHIADFWWRNTSNAGALWCDGKPDGERREIEEHEWDRDTQALWKEDDL